MFLCTGLQGNANTFVFIGFSSIIEDVGQGYIEISRVGVKVVVPYLYSKHKWLSRHGRNCIQYWIIGIDC
jgi:hypothetical protein